jgi:hypothetical protein
LHGTKASYDEEDDHTKLNNYKATLANLMLAFSTGKTVTIFTMNEGYGCHIHYVSVQA